MRKTISSAHLVLLSVIMAGCGGEFDISGMPISDVDLYFTNSHHFAAVVGGTVVTDATLRVFGVDEDSPVMHCPVKLHGVSAGVDVGYAAIWGKAGAFNIDFTDAPDDLIIDDLLPTFRGAGAGMAVGMGFGFSWLTNSNDIHIGNVGIELGLGIGAYLDTLDIVPDGDCCDEDSGEC